MKKTILAVLTGFAICAGQRSDAACSSKIHYASLPNESSAQEFAPTSFSLDLVRNVLWRGHAGERMSVCDESAKFYCFKSRPISFAVPKRRPRIGQSWTVNRRKYSLVGEQRLHLLGVDTTVLVIAGDDSHTDTKHHHYYYSMEMGLLALRLPPAPESEPRFVVAQSNCGFGARD